MGIVLPLEFRVVTVVWNLSVSSTCQVFVSEHSWRLQSAAYRFV
jgi:hypothetical protein